MNKHPIFNNTQFKKLRPMDRDVLLRQAIRQNFDRWNHEEQYDGLGCTSGFKHHQISMKAFASIVASKLSAASIPISSSAILSEPKMTIPASSAYKHVRRDIDSFCQTHLYECFERLLSEKTLSTQEKETAVVVNVVNVADVVDVVDTEKPDLKSIMAAILQESAEEEWE